jgi:predicted SnoaL-like aldol condensation-catalyzing enzyme
VAGEIFLAEDLHPTADPECGRFVNSMRSQFPGMHLEIKRVITQGKMVVTHSHLTLIPGEPGLALADFFRFEVDKVVEHWDVIQEIPDASANSNGMF